MPYLGVGATIGDASELMRKTSGKCVYLVDEKEQLSGSISDGDLRNAYLNGKKLTELAETIATKSPLWLNQDASQKEVQTFLNVNKILSVPLLNPNRTIARVAVADVVNINAELPNAVVIMAGGLGTRLRPLTNQTPKPMLLLGDEPILSKVIRRFYDLGFRKFYISVNYLKEQIIDHFGDGSRFGIKISYLEETQRLGTAGSLSLIQEQLEHPLIVTNADILTDFDYGTLVRFHEDNDFYATMGIREYRYNVPFGIVKEKDGVFQESQEKPERTELINSGIYCLSPACLESVPSSEFLDMPTLFSQLTREKKPCATFSVEASWIDIGTPESYELAGKVAGAISTK